MAEVTPNFRPFDTCGCGCGLEGILRAKPWASTGKTCVRRGCKCPQCRGLRNKRQGARSQRQGKKELGIKSSNSLHTGHEENDNVPWENKADKKYAKPVHTAWRGIEANYEANRPIGRGPLLFFRAGQPGVGYSLTVIRTDRLPEAIEYLNEALKLGLDLDQPQ